MWYFNNYQINKVNYIINCCYYFVSRYSPKNRFAQKMCYAEIEEPGSYLYLWLESGGMAWLYNGVRPLVIVRVVPRSRITLYYCYYVYAVVVNIFILEYVQIMVVPYNFIVNIIILNEPTMTKYNNLFRKYTY